jgi:hypothetical protein
MDLKEKQPLIQEHKLPLGNAFKLHTNLAALFKHELV